MGIPNWEENLGQSSEGTSLAEVEGSSSRKPDGQDRGMRAFLTAEELGCYWMSDGLPCPNSFADGFIARKQNLPASFLFLLFCKEAFPN